MNKETLIVKIGSESLVNFRKSRKIENLISGIVQKIQEGTQVLLVSSGAIQFGRENHNTDIKNKQVLAALGWHHLLTEYSDKFQSYKIGVAGFLVTHADIEDQEDRAKTLKETIYATWNAGILPIINENDPISTEEMREVGRGADNDKNALLLAKLFQAKSLFLITNTNGVYTNPEDLTSRIPSIQSSDLTPRYIDELCNGKSLIGTGGMASKLAVASEAGKNGIITHIGNGIDSGLHNTESGGTTILP